MDTFRRTGKVDNESNQGGRKRAHGNHDELVERIQTLAHSGLCSPNIAYVLRKQGIEVSDGSVRRWLQESGWAYQQVKVVPKLDKEAKKKRVRWAEQHIGFDWSKVLLTDSKILRGNITPAQAKKEKAWAPFGQAP
jgi:transposase